MTKISNWTWKQWMAAFFAGTFALGAVAYMTASDEEKAQWAKESAQREAAKAEAANPCTNEGAVFAAWGAVKRHLKDASDAEFQPANEAQVMVDSLGRFQVMSWVRSANSFNVPVQSVFVAVIACAPDPESWHEVSVDFMDQ